MKRNGLIAITALLLGLGLYAAYVQSVDFIQVSQTDAGYLTSTLSIAELSPLSNAYLKLFASLIAGLMTLFGGSLVAAVMVLALLVEMVTLFPAIGIQIKQKKIHLFHKKLVERFARGELTMSHANHERDILYSVNERIHRRGACLFAIQLVVFTLVLIGLIFMARHPLALPGTFSRFNLALLVAPEGMQLPVLAGLAYLLHALIKIHLRQREDFIDMKQIVLALGFAFISSVVTFFFSSMFPVVLTVYFLTQVTFATMRYVVTEEKAKEWGKHAQRELIKMLRSSALHKSKLEFWSRKFNHYPIIRHLNFHLLEEAISMSLAVIIVLNGIALM